MPRYEFVCENCHKPFELIMTISERATGEVPEVQKLEGSAAAWWFHGADVEEELSIRGEEGSHESIRGRANLLVSRANQREENGARSTSAIPPIRRGAPEFPKESVVA